MSNTNEGGIDIDFLRGNRHSMEKFGIIDIGAKTIDHYKKSIPFERAPSKILNRLGKIMHSAASLRKKGLACTQQAYGEKFCLDRAFSKNAQYKQKK